MLYFFLCSSKFHFKTGQFNNIIRGFGATSFATGLKYLWAFGLSFLSWKKNHWSNAYILTLILLFFLLQHFLFSSSEWTLMVQFVSVILQSVTCLSFSQQCPKRVISHGCSKSRGGGFFSSLCFYAISPNRLLNFFGVLLLSQFCDCLKCRIIRISALRKWISSLG